MRKRRIATLALALLSGPLLYAAAPVYGYLAEERPALRGPWGWSVVPASAPYAEGPVEPRYRDAAATARRLLERHRAAIHAPALSAAVAVDGRVVWAGATGWADLETRRAATPDSLFRIGSTSKAVTSTLLARLVDAGVIELDAPISRHAGQLPNPAWRQLTARQLASHTAGIPGYETNRDWIGLYRSIALRDHHEDVTEGLDYFDGSPLLYAPGSSYEYSSFDVGLLAVVLQRAGGKPFQALMRDRVNAPLGIETPLPDAPVPNRVQFYQLDGERARPWRSVDLSHKLAGGGFMARPADLARLGSAWLDPGFISAETRERLWTLQRLSNGEANPESYAVGWRVSDELWWSNQRLRNANHGGVAKGSMAWLVVIPERRMAVAMAINTNIWPFERWAGIQGELVTAFSQPLDGPGSLRLTPSTARRVR